MKDLFRKAWDCFLQHPSLGLPVLVTAIVSRSLESFQRPVIYRLGLWAMQTHSVLGPTSTSSTAPGWLGPIMAVIRLITIYAEAITNIFGILIAACLAYRQIAPHQSGPQPKVVWSRCTGGVLKVSLFVELLNELVAAVVFFMYFYFYVRKTHDHSNPTFSYFGYVQLLLSGLVTAYLVAPYLLRVIARALGQNQAQSESERLARYAVMVMTVITTVITFAITQALLKLPNSHVPPLLVGYTRSVIEALPQTLLAIVFGLLLANNDRPDPAVTATP